MSGTAASTPTTACSSPGVRMMQQGLSISTASTARRLSKDGVEPGYCPGPQAHDPLEPQIWFLCTLLVPEMEVEPMPLEGLR